MNNSQDYIEGYNAGLSEFAWWKDGEQFVGTCGKKLKDFLKVYEIPEDIKKMFPKLKSLDCPTYNRAKGVFQFVFGMINTEEQRSDKCEADKFLKIIKPIIIQAYYDGYEGGHNDTVENNYCDPSEMAEEYFEEDI